MDWSFDLFLGYYCICFRICYRILVAVNRLIFGTTLQIIWQTNWLTLPRLCCGWCWIWFCVWVFVFIKADLFDMCWSFKHFSRGSAFCKVVFLPHNAMYKCGLCHHAMSVFPYLLFPSLTLIIPHLFFCPYTTLCRHAVSVCLSVSLSHLCILSIRIIISSEIFTLTYHTIVFSYKMLW